MGLVSNGCRAIIFMTTLIVTELRDALSHRTEGVDIGIVNLGERKTRQLQQRSKIVIMGRYVYNVMGVHKNRLFETRASCIVPEQRHKLLS